MGKKEILIEHVESATTVKLVLKRPTMRYMDEFMSLKCAPDLLAMKLFPNSKEVTETFASYRAITRNLFKTVNVADTNVTLVSIGDGSTPRTAAMFAHRSRWTCVSVDPNLGNKGRWQGIDRLHMFPKKVEDLEDHKLRPLLREKVLLVGVHSHADLQQAFLKFDRHNTGSAVIGVVALPCCVPQLLWDIKPSVNYADWGIWSPERQVNVWTPEDLIKVRESLWS